VHLSSGCAHALAMLIPECQWAVLSSPAGAIRLAASTHW
jgi:hypothetical protein